MAAVRRHVGHDRPLSLDEAIHVAQGLSRRDFLKLGGIAASGLMLAGCDLASGDDPSPTGQAVASGSGADTPRVVIVGAGLAGMTAAYRLHQAGLPTQVFEARDRVGGRCWSARDFAGGQVGEHGGEFVDTRHVHLRVLADELGLELDDLWAPWDADTISLNYVDGALVSPGRLFHEMAPAVDEIVRLARQGPIFAGEAPAAIRALDEQTEAEWYAEHVGATDTALYRMWSQRQSGWYGLDPDALSAVNLIDFYAIDYPGGDERYTIRGGNDQVPGRILDALPEGTVTLEAPLEAMIARDDATTELRFAGQEPVIADRVILTLPFTTLRDVDLTDAGLPNDRMRAIEDLGMGTNAKVLMQFDRPFFTGFGGWGGSLNRGDDPILGTWESGATDTNEPELGLLTVYTGGAVGAGYGADEPHAPASAEVVDVTLAAIEDAEPSVREAFTGTAWLDSWVQDPWIHGSYTAFLPGQTTAWWGTLGRPIGTVHFAGEHTSVYSQGFLNGGVESGDRAAGEVIAALGRDVPPGLARTRRMQRRYEPVFPWA
jgi:monoamine oxidase